MRLCQERRATGSTSSGAAFVIYLTAVRAAPTPISAMHPWTFRSPAVRDAEADPDRMVRREAGEAVWHDLPSLPHGFEAGADRIADPGPCGAPAGCTEPLACLPGGRRIRVFGLLTATRPSPGRHGPLAPRGRRGG